ncbi:glycosyltransferase [Hungatella effluvii]|uniref:glycosyltransferase n=1 Tax=Hungatella effluvii TaxID=1096246 RepID=UPI0022E490D1|nr:glycosyltransferase [Hungatella effluvii]
MRQIKILQVNKLYYPETGGIERTLQQISEGLNGVTDLKVLVCQKKGKGSVDMINGVEVHRAGSLGVISSVPISIPFIKYLRSMSRDREILQFHMPFPLGDLACLLSGYKGKVIAYWHSDVVKQKKWMILYQPVMNLFLKRTDLIIVGAEGIAKGSTYLGPFMDKVKVVPFAVSDEILQAGEIFINKCQEREDGPVRFLFIGRLVYYKGCSVLLEALAGLNHKAELLIVGDGPLKEELVKKCSDLDINDKVSFLGHISDNEVHKCLERSDVFVLPSVERSEAFGLVQLEAMAYGLPVINTNLNSGVPEVSIDGETGLTVEPNNSEELRDAMDWLISHPEERQEMGAKARKRLEHCFTQKLLVENIMNVYNEVLTR